MNVRIFVFRVCCHCETESEGEKLLPSLILSCCVCRKL